MMRSRQRKLADKSAALRRQLQGDRFRRHYAAWQSAVIVAHIILPLRHFAAIW